MGEEAHTPAPGSGWPAWEEVRQRAYRLLQSRFAYGLQPADWEDMAQEVVLKVIIARETETVDLAQFDRWLPTVVRNVARDRYRTEHGRHGEREFVAWQDEHESEDEDRQLTQALASRDVHALLDATTTPLPHERTVLELSYWYDLTSQEIANVLGDGHSASTVRTWHRNALAKLRERARDRAEEEGNHET